MKYFLQFYIFFKKRCKPNKNSVQMDSSYFLKGLIATCNKWKIAVAVQLLTE